MRQTIHTGWHLIMDSQHNPLRHIPDMNRRHFVMQILAWMWCIIFSMYLGSIVAFGISAVIHAVLIAGIVITVATFETAKNNSNLFRLRLEHKTNGYHTPSRTRYMYYDGKRIELDKNDPGGDHE